MQARFKALILTYKTAPVAIREHVSLNEAGAKDMLRFMREHSAASDVLVVSTCNRTEIYYQSGEDLTALVLSGLQLIKGFADDISGYFSSLTDDAAISHLFEVAIGLDAQVVGDLQISGQVKSAYQWSADEGMAGPFLHRLMHTIFFANKRVVQETSFRDGAASLSYAVKELAEELTTGLANPKILVLGVGEIGRDVVRNFKDSKIDHLTILNRTEEKARKLAIEADFRAGSMAMLPQEVAQADVIISSVSGGEPIIAPGLMRHMPIFSHKFFIDLSMPRSIDPAIEELPGVVLYNLDDIREKTNEAVEKRKAAIPRVQEIIREAMGEFSDWTRDMIVSPTIQKLKNALEQIRREEMARFLKHATPQEASKLEEMSRSLTQKILKYPVLQLKAACKRGDPDSLADILHDLFDLDKVRENKE